MEERTLLVLSVIVLALALAIGAATVSRWRDARLKAAQVTWMHRELRRALQQLEATDSAEVLAGLQTLTMINDRVATEAALPKIEQLSRSDDRHVARQAAVALERVWKRQMRADA